jgi:filamentous hemagglutinin family protein
MMKSLRKIFRRRYFRQVVIYFLTWCLVLNTSLPYVWATPTPSGGGFTVGTGSITQSGNATNVVVDQTQSVIEWNSLDTIGGAAGVRESLNFSQGALANSAVLNRVMSGYGTQFFGDLNADAGMRIFIVNPAGIVFGEGSTVNVTQLIASNLNITNDNFLSGNYEFAGDIDGVDVYERLGVINNSDNLYGSEGVALIGKKILNTGTITTDPGGFVVMAAGDRVLLGQPGSKIVVEMDSVTPTEEGDGNVINEGQISSPSGTVVLAAGDIFSVPLHPQLKVNTGTEEEPVYDPAAQPVRVEKGIGTVTQSGTINADGTDGDGGSVVLTAGDNVVLGDGSLTTANGGTSNDSAKGGEVIAYASEIYAPDDPGALVDFQDGAQIEVRGGVPSDPSVLAPEDAEKFKGGLAEISGDHLYFNGSVDAVSVPFDVTDPLNPYGTVTVTPEGGTVHVDPINLTLANGAIPAEGAARDTFYEKELEAYSQAGVNTTLEADYDITVENITDGMIEGGKGDIALRTEYNNGSIVFEPATEGGPIETIVQTTGGGNIFMLAGSGGIKTGRLQTYEDGGNPGRIRIFTNNGGNIETRALNVDGGNDVEVSIIASGNLTIDGRDDSGVIQPGVLTSTNKVPSKESQVGTAYICLVSETGSVNVIGAVEVEAHGKQQTVARIHICADDTVSVHTRNGRVQAVAKTSSAGTADAQIKIHAGSSDPGAITITRDVGGTPVRIQANTSGSSIGPLDFSGAVTEYEQTSGGSHVFVQIADHWLGVCDDCPTPPDLLPPIEPPQHSPIAVDDGYTINKGDALVIILDTDGVLNNDYDPDGDSIIVIVLGGRDTTEGGSVVMNEDGGFTYTPPEEKLFDEYGSDGEGDYAIFTDTFTYEVRDERGLESNQATVTITSKNYIPVAQPDEYDVVHNTSLDLTQPDSPAGVVEGVLPTNADYDPDPGDTLTAVLDGDGSTALGGTVTLNEDGSFVYTPPTDTVGTDSFTYYATDGYNNSETVEVTIELTNTPPVAQPDSYSVVHNTNLDLTQPDSPAGVVEGVLPANADYDPDPGDTLTAVLDGDGTTSLGGNVTLNADGSFSYEPPANTVGTDSFTYYVSDNYGGTSEPVQVTIDLTNTVPVAQPDTYHVAYNTQLSPTVDQGIITGVVPAENGDYDLDPGDSLTPYLPGDLVTGPTDQGGTVTLNPDGSFTYTPASGFSGTDSFTYYVTDSYDNSGSVEVKIYVGTMPTPPAAPVPYIQPAPGLQREVLETSGCPALAKWAAAELGTDEGKIEIWMVNSVALGRDIQPCDACANLKEAATILQDADGSRLAALAQVISRFASSTAPPTEEQMASIADAIANDVEGNVQYAAAGEYLDALAKYVGILTSDMGYSADQAVQLATDNYVQKLAEGENMGVATYVAARLAALAGS